MARRIIPFSFNSGKSCMQLTHKSSFHGLDYNLNIYAVEKLNIEKLN